MGNMREEILKSVLIQLQAKSESIMLEINILLSKPEGVENITDKISMLMTKLSANENSITQTHSLLSQSISQRIDMISKMKKEKNDNNS